MTFVRDIKSLFLGVSLSVQSLPQLVDHLGLSASVRVLLPILLPESLASAELLGLCRDAVAERQTVVHQGQRHVDPARLRKHLRVLRELCEKLLDSSTA